MRRPRFEAVAAALALVLTSAGASVSEVETSTAGAEWTSLNASFQTGKSLTVTWGGSTDAGSGLASYSVTVRRAPFNGTFGPPQPFKTDVLAAPTDPVVAAAGDIACGKDSTGTVPEACWELQTSDVLLQINPAVVLPLGDVQYQYGELDDFYGGRPGWANTGYHPTWGRLKSVTRPVVGNHEYDPTRTPNAEGYFDYFNGIGNFTGPAGDRDKGYYSFDVGSWHVVILNSNCTPAGGCNPGSPQQNWLRTDLAAHQRSCTLAAIHQPAWSSENRSSADHPGTQALLQPLYDQGVDLLLAGHSHFYERFPPQNPSHQVDLARGIRQIIVGSGGRDVTTNFTNPIEMNSEVLEGNTFGVLKVTLHPKSYDWEFVPIAGQSFTDSGTTACHGLVSDTTPPTVPTMGGAGTTGSATFIGEPGFTYCFQATATDWDGNTSGASAEDCTAVPVDNIAFRHRGGWIKKKGAGHYLETFSQTKLLGATLTLKNVSAKRLAIIVTKCRKCGLIQVFFGGNLLKRIQLRSPTTKKLVTIVVKTFDSVRTGTVRVKVVSADKIVKIEGLGVSAV